MIDAQFYEIGSNRPLDKITMEHPPERADIVVLPGQGDYEWLVEVRRFRPRGGAVAWRREEVELWVSLV